MSPRVAAAWMAVLAAITSAAACVSLDGLAGGSLDAGTGGDAATDAGAGDAPPGSEGPAPCGDTATDPHNCGACGHDCLGSACSGGTCAPTPLVVGLAQPPACVAVDALDVYWATRDCPGGTMCIGGTSLVGDAGPFVVGTGSDDFGASWSDCALLPNGTLVVGSPDPNGFVDEFPQGATAESRFAYGTAPVVALAVTRQGGVAWTTGNGWVYACGSFCNNTPRTIAAAQATPAGIATDGVDVYWANQGDGTIARSPFDGDGGQVTVVASDAASPTDVAFDDGGVYWVESASGSVIALASGASKPVVLATGPVGADAVVVDGDRIYWSTMSGTVMRVGKDGGAPLTLASGQASPADVAVDSRWVYWANGVGDGGIYRVAK